MLSIIIPTYNCKDKITETIASLDSLSDELPHEVIFVDDSSNDGTYDSLLAESSSRKNWRVLKLETNSGSAARPRNVGINNAIGTFVFFLDADDAIIPAGIMSAYEFAVQFESDVVRSSLVSVNPGGDEVKVDSIPRWDTIKDRVSRIRAITKYQSLTCSFVMRRDVLTENNIRFDEDRRIGEDITFTARVLTYSKKIAYRDLPVRKYVKRGAGESSITQTIRDADFQDFYRAWADVEETLFPVGVSFMREHGRAALLYALRQYVWFKTENIGERTFAEFSSFINEHWSEVSKYNLTKRYRVLIEAVRDGNYQRFIKESRIRMVIAGHDLKFIQALKPYFSSRYVVEYDKWAGHTQHDESTSSDLLEWADYIWVEWLLGAAVWYSKRVRSDQRLIVRTHRSEMHVDYGMQIDRTRVSKFVAITPHCLGDFSDRFDIPRTSFALIPNPFEVDSYARVSDPNAMYRIAMVGVVPALKGFDRAIGLLHMLRKVDDRFTLHIFGRPPEDYDWVTRDSEESRYFESCQSMIDELDLQESIVYEGWVDTRVALASVGYVVSMSDFEGMQVSPGEAYCAGGVGLFRRWRGVEACYPGEFIFESVEQIASYITSIPDFESFTEASSRGRDFIEERYGIAIVEDEVTHMLASVRG